MSKVKINVGYVYSPQANQQLYMQRVYGYGNFLTVNPGERRGVDILIIPDGVGLYPGVQGFVHSAYEAACLEPMCNMAEFFRIHERGLEHYRENQTKIIGVGQGAWMLWNSLGEKLTVYRGKVEMELPKDEKQFTFLSKKDFFVDEFQVGNYVGVRDLYSNTLNTILREEAALMARAMKEIEEDAKQQKRDRDADDDYLAVPIEV